MIEAGLLRHLNPRLGEDEAAQVADVLSQGAEKYSINTRRRVAAFVAQCCHESAGFRVMEENLNYKAATLLKMFPYTPRRKWGFTDLIDASNVVAGGPRAIANRIYGSRMGNDPTGDDGFNFRGSGDIQLTGRDAFALYEAEAGEDIVDAPDKVRALPHAALSACWVFGSWKRCNPLADAWEITAVGAKINGANPPYGNAERIELSNHALEWLGG